MGIHQGTYVGERDRVNRMERKVIEAVLNEDWGTIKHWVRDGYITKDYAYHIHGRVKRGWTVNIPKISTMPNPCGEIPLGEPQEGARFKHPTARVDRRMLLIG